MVVIDEAEHLAHYGILRRSGRYPWGSGGDQATRNAGFLGYVDNMKKKGLTEAQIARGLSDSDEKISVAQLRAAGTIARNEQKAAEIAMAQKLHDKGNSNVAIGKRIGKNESYVRTLLEPGAKDKADVLTNTSKMLERQVAEKKFVYVGTGVESHLNISKEKLGAAVAVLQEKGYAVHVVKVPQATTAHDTSVKVLCPPGTTWGEVQRNKDSIKQIDEISDTGGRSFGKTHDPISLNPNRVKVQYNTDPNTSEDGVIYIRPGVEDVSLGQSHYAQVRVQVGDGHYMKGMAIYKEGLPSGIDVVFNTDKPRTGNKLDAMKPLKTDSELPFGAIVSQIVEDRGGPNERLVSSMNIVNEEGDWGKWKKSLASQVLSKQSPVLAKKQLGITYTRRQEEFDQIMALTNPTIKKKLLQSFADSTDSAAVHLKAAGLSARQMWQVILPITSIKPTEVYAPNFINGERVSLIRYPHGGTFEIPELTVNNRNREATKMLGNAKDAIGIHPLVARRLSGADFDGDSVIVIPNNKGELKSTPALEGLKGFDPKHEYPPYDGMRTIDGGVYRSATNEIDYTEAVSNRKQNEMGNVSNLITDMTIRQASNEELARAIRHSMVVIDAEKHALNWKLSAERNGISSLKEKYLKNPENPKSRGASTLVSRASATIWIDQKKLRPAKEGGSVDSKTGALVYVPRGLMKPGPKGTEVPRQQKSKRLAETSDAHTLSSGTPIEKIYADHSNELKALANRARLEELHTPALVYSPSANKIYAKEVASLKSKMKIAEQNRPLEVQSQIIANSQISAKLKANPGLDSASVKKIKNQAINDARNRVGANKKERRVEITQEEWNAIQAGAISNHGLKEILTNTDLESIRAYATPRHANLMSPSKIGRAQAMLASGSNRAEIAKVLGVSITTLNTALSEGEA